MSRARASHSPGRRARLALAALLALSPWAFSAPDAGGPRADLVVLRGSRDLAAAVSAAVGPAGGAEGARRCVVLILDVTENTAKAGPQLAEALERLAATNPAPGAWSIARLGEPVGPALPGPDRLRPLLQPLLARPTPVLSTVAALRQTLASVRTPRCAVVYLADWRFDDDEHLEAFVTALSRGEHTFSVVGSEAAFGRAFNDGFREASDRWASKAAGQEQPYEPGIGRDPFGPGEPLEPWHGGDTTHPGRPYRWAAPWWKSEFSPGDLEPSGAGTRAPLEELARRLPGFAGGGGAAPEPGAAFRRVPLPSAFGPYGLMRAAATSGGRYVLWSWNPAGRAGVTYDYGRCNLFAPDLRARDAVRGSLSRDPCASACVEGWHALLEVEGALLEQTAPLTRSFGAQALEVTRPLEALRLTWTRKAERDAFVKAADDLRAALDQAARALDQGLAREADAAPRHAADARLFRHVVEVARFEVGEAQAAARAVPAADFEEGAAVTLREEPWIRPGRDPERIETTTALPLDAAAAERVRAARAEHLRRFAGTPFGEEVALNPVLTFRAERVDLQPLTGLLPGSGRSPGESKGAPKVPTPPAPRPGAGSGGGAPSTPR